MSWGLKRGLHVRSVTALMIVLAIILAMPAAALAANAYNQTFAGKAVCQGCHYPAATKWAVDYNNTAHNLFVTDLQASPAAAVPPASKWPAPSIGSGLRFDLSEIKWMLGAPGIKKEYVSNFLNSGAQPMLSGQSILPTITGPADDMLFTEGLEWLPGEGIWDVGIVEGRTYFQGCGGCHHLGVTRPGWTLNQPLASGTATMTRSTVTTVSSAGIQCEHCHGTGQAAAMEQGGHYSSGVKIVRTKRALKSEACGQCHATMTSKELNWVNKTFSQPNGFTPDLDLKNFVDVYGIAFRRETSVSPQPIIPTADKRFWPNGSNKGMNHVYYNEWAISAHARSLRFPNGDLWTSYAQETCLECHSGEGFLKKIGYGNNGAGNDVYWGGSSLATDELNIECAVCHTVHDKTNALGLRLPPDELCSACHNGLIAEGQQATLGTQHHTQKEMREGYGLIGVANSAEQFMGDAECIECHMPETRNPAGGRKTHSFKVMTPGTAAAWGVWSGGDSCTGCHNSVTRTDLQADLDEWEDTLAGLSEEVSVAVAAAKLLPAATTPGGDKLIRSAETNKSFVEADESKGAHNFPYAEEGLEKALVFAKAVGAKYTQVGVTAYSSSTGVSALYGTLKNGDNTPVANTTVTIQRRATGTTVWADYTTAVTSVNGAFGLAVEPVTSHAGVGSTDFRVVWNPGISEGTVSSAVMTAAIGSKTTIRSSRTSMPLGYSATISGLVSPNHAGRVVTIQVKRGTGAWTTLARKTLTSTSAYAQAWRPSSRSTYYFRTIFATDGSHVGSTSPTISVRVY